MEESRGNKIREWFEPFLKCIELLTPAASVAIQAYPNPGALVLGGIVGLLQTTNRLISYQKLTLRMLARMGLKAQIMLAYERDIYKDDPAVQISLVQVYGDIIAFCLKAFRFVVKTKKNGELRARIKGRTMVMVRDYDSHFEKEVQNFEAHMDHLESRACICFRKHVEKMSESQAAHYKAMDHRAAEASEHFRRQDEYWRSLLKREEALRERELTLED